MAINTAKFSSLVLGATAMMTLLSSGKLAQAATITGYDITNARTSGFGSWGHTYGGTITPTGATAIYSGGTGTMADGSIGANENQSQLFLKADNPVLTFFLDNTYQLNNLSLFNFNNSGGNGIPGNITGFDVTIGGNTQTIATTVLGVTDEFADLSSTTLSLLPTNTFSLSNFTTTGSFPEYFAISEVNVNGQQVASVPEPFTIIGTLIGGTAAFRMRKKIKDAD